MYSYRITHNNQTVSEVVDIAGFYTKDGLLLLTNDTGTVCIMISICNIILIEITEQEGADNE